jgi:hypothetical protein
MVDNLEGIPNVDLTPILDELEGDTGTTETAPAKKETPEGDLAQFKDPDALLKGYKEVQGFATKVSQENKELADKVKEYEEQVKDMQENLQMSAQATPLSDPKTFDETYYDNPKAAIAQVVAEQVATQRITDALEVEQEKDSDNFQERYGWAQMAAKASPHLGRTPAGVRKLFKQGDKLRKEGMKKSANSALEHIFGGPLDPEAIAKLKTLMTGDATQPKNNTNNNAYMPDISSSTKTGADTEKGQSPNARIAEAEANGDVDGVLAGIFAAKLAE